MIEEVAAVRPDQLSITLRYNSKVALPRTGIGDLATVTQGTMLAGWTVTLVDHSPIPGFDGGRALTLLLTAPSGSFAEGRGTILNLQFDIPPDASGYSALMLSAEAPTRRCAAFSPRNGMIAVVPADVSDADSRASNGGWRDVRIGADAARMTYALIQPGRVVVEIINSVGRRVALLVDAYQEAGDHSIEWMMKDMPAGPYFCRLVHGDSVQVERIMVIR
jgi:hypothetical protein